MAADGTSRSRHRGHAPERGLHSARRLARWPRGSAVVPVVGHVKLGSGNAQVRRREASGESRGTILTLHLAAPAARQY
eukprot:3502577-Prymnesium_polylepis.1